MLTDGVAHAAERLDALLARAEAAAAAAPLPAPPSPHTSAALRALTRESSELLSRVAAAEAAHKELAHAARALAARVANVTAILEIQNTHTTE